MRALAAALMLVLAVPLGAQELPAWRAVDAATGQIADVAGLEQLARDFPDSTSVRLRLFNAQLQAGEGEAALASLAWLKVRGHVFTAGAQAQIPALIGSAHEDAARALLIAQAEVIAASTIFETVQAEAGLIETVFVAPNGIEALATSVSQRAVFVRGGEAEWIAFPIPDANALSGLVAAQDNSIGWIASANIDGSPDDPARFTGLYGLTGDFADLLRIPAPQGVKLSDLAAGPDGTVYASDPEGGGIYRARRDSAQLTALVAPGTLRSPQGLAVSADGQRLYVSDYRYGLAVVDLASGAVSRLASDVPAALDGIDGLWRDGDTLIAVQNGTSPMRISALTLSADGTRITGQRVLEKAHPDWTEPLGGNIAGGALTYVATGQWDRYDKGVLREGASAIPTQIRRLPLAPH
jgi:streptogramin lyase